MVKGEGGRVFAKSKIFSRGPEGTEVLYILVLLQYWTVSIESQGRASCLALSFGVPQAVSPISTRSSPPPTIHCLSGVHATKLVH